MSDNGGASVRRSASPAKRSAADMEDSGTREAGMEAQQQIPGSFPSSETAPSHFDDAMKSMETQTQATMQDSESISIQTSMATNTPATSFEDDKLPPYSTEDPLASQVPQQAQMPSYDEQERRVREYLSKPLDEGDRGVVFSTRWLSRVLARTTEGMTRSDLPKEAREGDVGPIDALDILPDGAFNQRNILYDVNKQPFIPLKPGLTINNEIEVLPYELWDIISGWYGSKYSTPILRFAHNSAPPEATSAHIIYELYPPIFTIRKLVQSSQQTESPPTPPEAQSKKSIDALRLRDERYRRGQKSPDDAIRFVSSRTERFHRFLHRSKEAAGIPIQHKVKIWRVLEPTEVKVEKAGNQAPSPPTSRSTSPTGESFGGVKLAVISAEWQKMEVGVDIEHVNASDHTNDSNYNGSSTMELLGLFASQTLVLEPQITGLAGGEYSSDAKPRSRFSLLAGKKGTASKAGSTTTSRAQSPVPTGVMTRGRARRDGRVRGTVGLNNLGNTCYMNSALQCIRSVEELAIYFLSGKYKGEINDSNPLGHHGAIAKHYAGVLEGIYGDKSGSTFNPSNFKRSLGSAAPMFSGYGQQDSQEFLSFLVDAIHEDLNRIIKKPYIENPDSDDNTVHDPQAIVELGETFRENHKKRNDSVAMDLFSGFYKNTMECPVCDKVSVTFDPYSLVTVQLPVENTFQHVVTFVPYAGRAGHNVPVNHVIDIDKNATIKSVKQVIASKHPGVDAKKLWMVEVYSHKLYKYFDDQTTIAEANITANDFVFCFELEDVPTNVPTPSKSKSLVFSTYSYGRSSNESIPAEGMHSSQAEKMAVPIFMRERSDRTSSYSPARHPQYILVTKEEAQDYDVIFKKVLVAMAQLTSRPILTEFDEAGDAASLTETDDTASHDNGEKLEPGDEDAGRISDRSVPSEDEYVDVSIDKEALPRTDDDSNGTASNGLTVKQHPRIPADFMGAHYRLPAALRNQLFALNYAESADNSMLCTSMSSFNANSVRPMLGRVKKPARRTSTQSSASVASMASTVSGHDVNGEAEETSEPDDDETNPSITNAESPLPTTEDAGESDDNLPLNPLDDEVKKDLRHSGRGKGNKFNKKNRRSTRNKTYSRKDRQQGNNPANSRAPVQSVKSHKSFAGKNSPESDENPYYIKIGEAIVVDWTPEALHSLFGGDADIEEDLRGIYLSADDGRTVEEFHDPEQEAKLAARKERKRSGVTLDDCFDETGKREVLSEDNAWYCNRCKELRQAHKTLEIWTAPEILVVHLKRFGGNRSFRDKVDVMVNYPINEGLDMTRRIGHKESGKEYIYDLFAVDNHYGGLGGGHYTAMAKNFNDGQWYDYNDSMVSKIGEGSAKLKSAAAYLLFYRRRSEKPLGPEYLQDLVNEYHNPTAEVDGVPDEMDDSDAGEGRLGDPSSRLRGSSSNGKAGAGVAAGSQLRGGAGGPGAGNSLTQRNLMARNNLPADDEDEGVDMSADGNDDGSDILNDRVVYGPRRPSSMGYGNQGMASWNFDGLDNGRGALLQSVEGGGDNFSTSSTAADASSMHGNSPSGQDRLMEDFGDDETNYGNGYEWSGGRNSPADRAYEQAYPSSQGEAEALHLENAGSIGEDVHDIKLSPRDEADEHMKTD